MEIINLDEHRPIEDLAHITLALDCQGKPMLCLTWASDEFIEGHECISDRFVALKRLVENSLPYLEEMAKEFEEE